MKKEKQLDLFANEASVKEGNATQALFSELHELYEETETEADRQCKQLFNTTDDSIIGQPQLTFVQTMERLAMYEGLIEAGTRQAATGFQLQQELAKNALYHPYLPSEIKEQALQVRDKIKVELTQYHEKNMLTIHYEDILPIFERGKNKDLYMLIKKAFFFPMSERIVRCLKDNEIKTTLFNEKVCVACVQYYPNNVIRDLDNHIYYFIHNALRYSEVCADDNWRSMMQLQLGKLSGNGSKQTKIYVFPLELLPQFSSEYLLR